MSDADLTAVLASTAAWRNRVDSRDGADVGYTVGVEGREDLHTATTGGGGVSLQALRPAGSARR